jgi:hypothetical protein
MYSNKGSNIATMDCVAGNIAHGPVRRRQSDLFFVFSAWTRYCTTHPRAMRGVENLRNGAMAGLTHCINPPQRDGPHLEPDRTETATTARTRRRLDSANSHHILNYRSSELQIPSALQFLRVAFTRSPRSTGESVVSSSAHTPSKQLRMSTHPRWITVFPMTGAASLSHDVLEGDEQAPKKGVPIILAGAYPSYHYHHYVFLSIWFSRREPGRGTVRAWTGRKVRGRGQGGRLMVMVVKVHTSRNSETVLHQTTEHSRVELNGREPLYIKPHSAEYNKTLQ